MCTRFLDHPEEVQKVIVQDSTKIIPFADCVPLALTSHLAIIKPHTPRFFVIFFLILKQQATNFDLPVPLMLSIPLSFIGQGLSNRLFQYML